MISIGNTSGLTISILFISGCLISMSGQNTKTHENTINDKRIKTVQIHRDSWNLSYPVLNSARGEKLILSFDLLDDQPESYYYSFIHCDKDWNESGAFVNDYIDGFEENPIEDYNTSFNTTVHYYHYSVTFPNDRISLKLSGNYMIIVYRPGEKDNPALKQRFMITEDAVQINVNAHRPQMTADNNSHQQIDFTVNHSRLKITDPYREIYSFILQNGRWDNARKNLKPDFHGNNELKYGSLSDRNIFPGGNEFRYFDIRSIRYLSEYVRNIQFAQPYYNIYLQPSENREYKPYFYWKDFNGKYYIAVQEGRNPETDADYLYVYFTLPAYQPAEGGKIYVSGALNNWKYDSNNEMTYNNQFRQYECTMLLKQGWYDYEYAFVEDGAENGLTGPFEGNHYETENDYLILIYYRNPRERYDRLIGTAVQNTLNRISD
jgi:hypothetical protein